MSASSDQPEPSDSPEADDAAEAPENAADAIESENSSENPTGARGSNRRDFLTGRSAAKAARDRVDETLDAANEAAPSESRQPPGGGPTVRLSVKAMACDFSVIMNPGPSAQLDHASAALEMLEPLEQMMTVYRADSDMSRCNREAQNGQAVVGEELFGLLQRSVDLSAETERAFDPTTGPLIALWRQCRSESRLPDQDEIDRCLQDNGVSLVHLDRNARSVAFDHSGVEFNLGGVGKGYALDRLTDFLTDAGMPDFLLHGGYSSMRACGDHGGTGGWPVGIRNPLFARERWATLLLCDAAMSTSGSSVQHYRQDGRRWGHILDPRTGWPAEQMLSCTVVAPTAELADALSTAFFVGGVEIARAYCDNHPSVNAILMPPPRRGRTLEPVICGSLDEVLFLNSDS